MRSSAIARETGAAIDPPRLPGSRIATELAEEPVVPDSETPIGAMNSPTNAHYVYEAPILSPFYRHAISPLCEKFVIYFMPSSISPNFITLAGLTFACVGAFLLEYDMFLSAAVFWVLYAWCDNLDGKQARIYGMSSAAGEYLDHIVDSFVCSLLSLYILKTLIPFCYSVSSFSLRAYLAHPLYNDSAKIVPLDEIHTYWTPFLVMLFVAQVPFYIGLWANNVTGRLLVGMSMTGRSWVTVDEVNFFLVPLLCILRHWASKWIFYPVFTLKSSARFVLCGHDCRTGVLGEDPSIITMTIGSLACLGMVIFASLNGFPLILYLSRRSALHFPLTLLAYTAIVLLLPLPPIVLIPFFSWICSCLIFRMMLGKYEHIARAAHSSGTGAAATMKLPPYPVFAKRKSVPLCLLLACSCILHVASIMGNENLVATTTLAISAFSALVCAAVVVTTCDWLQKASIVLEALTVEQPTTTTQLTEALRDEESMTSADQAQIRTKND